MSTPHIAAEKGDFAKTVLMPGDPLRAKFIAENFLENARLVNNVRDIQGYTGEYKGKRVSVMASGMGMPSIAIYAHELYNFFDVENIIRVGTAGGMNKNVHIRDIVLGQGACTDSNFASQFGVNGTFCPIADFGLLKKAYEISEEMGLTTHVGNLYSTDVFYNDDSTNTEKWSRLGVLAVEMEAAALYMTAQRFGKKALAVCTVSDHLITGESTSAEERQTTFTDMMRLALEVAITSSFAEKKK